jgi:hypothetical protein
MLIAFLIVGCEHEAVTDAPVTLAPKFSSLQANIFSTNCAVSGCHLGSSAPHGLDLSAGSAYANLVGVASAEVPALKRVAASKPDSSYLVAKIEGSALIAPGTGRMPLGRTPLTAEQIASVRQWIAAGALND